MADSRGTSASETTVLVAEDDHSARVFVRQVLRGLGCTVLEAEDGPAALAAAQANPGTIHLLITDMLLPGFGGGELADQLRKARPDLKVLYLSAYYEHEVLHLMPQGAAFLSKPFFPGDLQGKVGELLGW